MCKKFQGNTIIGFDSIHREKIRHILLVHGLSKEIVTTITMLYKTMRSMVCPPNGNTDFFDVVTGVLQGDSTIYTYNLLRLHTMTANGSNKRKWFHIKKRREVDYNILQKL